MNLSDLKLNRFLYKDNSDILSADVVSSIYSTPQNNQTGGQGYQNSPSMPQIPANGVASNTTIQSSLLQSSPSSYRIEIDPKGNWFRALDNHNRVIVQIDPTFGIFTEFLEANLVTIDALFVNKEFVYKDVVQPVTYIGQIDGATGVLSMYTPNTTFTAVKNSTGAYTITHNLGNAAYVLMITATDDASNPVSVKTITATNDCAIFIYDLTGTPFDSNFQFSLQDIS